MTTEQLKPIYDEPCERLVIGTLLSIPDAWHENIDILSDSLFYTVDCNIVYKAMHSVIAKGETCNIFSVLQEMNKTQGANFHQEDWSLKLVDMSNLYTVGGLRSHITVLQDCMRRRKLTRTFLRGLQEAQDKSVDTEQIQTETIDSLGELFQTATSDTKSVRQIADEFTKEIVDANRKGTRKVNISTGFQVLDDKGGLQPSDLVVVAADSSQGKTAFMLRLTRNIASDGSSVAIYSMEMTAAQLFARMVAMATGIPSNILNTKPLTDEQYKRYLSTSEMIAKTMMFFDEKSTNSLDGIIASIRTLAYKKGIKVAAVDYLQIINLNLQGMNKEQATATAARRLKNLAKELNICIIALSQLTRDRDNPEPSMARLRDSGQIAEAADMVILIYRPEVYGKQYSGEYSNVSTQGTALINLTKGRNTGTAKFITGFDASCTNFYEIDQNNLPRTGETPKPKTAPPYIPSEPPAKEQALPF